MYPLIVLKRKLESLLMAPFIVTGVAFAELFAWKKQYRTVFFFPFYHIGGAEKIHAQIVQATGGPDCLLVFTRKSANDRFLEEFHRSGCTVLDLSAYTGSKWLYPLNFIFRGYVSRQLNRMKVAPVVFNGHSNFAYKISPWLRKSIRQIDLVHSVNSFSLIRIPYIRFYETCVLISLVKLDEHRALYRKYKIPETLISRFQYIPNAVPFPDRDPLMKQSGTLTVIFNGRNSPEKRFGLFEKIAAATGKADPEIRFKAIGISKDDASGTIDLKSSIDFLGTIHDPARIHDILWESQVLMLTSETEGFPLVVIEAMANGCAIVATPVGDLPVHIEDGVRGFLFRSVSNEEQIVSEAVAALLRLRKEPHLWKRMSAANIFYAKQHFSMAGFAAAYQSLLDHPKNNQR